jgi:hypothetical protein
MPRSVDKIRDTVIPYDKYSMVLASQRLHVGIFGKLTRTRCPTIRLRKLSQHFTHSELKIRWKSISRAVLKMLRFVGLQAA